MEFKTCSTCHCIWAKREDFIKNPGIKLIGYQPYFEEPDKGLFLFNHIEPSCGTTLALQVDLFADLYSGQVYKELKRGLGECGGNCLTINDLTPCSAQCSMAHIRQIMQTILSFKPVLRHKVKLS